MNVEGEHKHLDQTGIQGAGCGETLKGEGWHSVVEIYDHIEALWMQIIFP